MAHIVTRDGTTFIRDDWDAEDIRGEAINDHDTTLTADEVRQVMDIVVEGFDCNIGINWDVISIAIGQFIEGQPQDTTDEVKDV